MDGRRLHIRRFWSDDTDGDNGDPDGEASSSFSRFPNTTDAFWWLAWALCHGPACCCPGWPDQTMIEPPRLRAPLGMGRSAPCDGWVGK